ncbi:MAG TPA: trehalase family glycosidase [bacterium]|nr:trehalase family glycosidase [bacterium]
MTVMQEQWQALDRRIQTWWDAELHTAREQDLMDPKSHEIWSPTEEHRQRKMNKPQLPTLLYLPFPYITAGGGEAAFPEMYCWDTYFINRALALHGRFEIIRHHILNQLFLIERYGMVLTGNRTYYLGRSQTPLHSDSVLLYYEHTRDLDMISRAYPVLKQEYQGYWLADHHQTRSGLATNRDLTELSAPAAAYDLDESLRPELASEAEVMDFTAIYAGDVRACNPLQTNCVLVNYARNLAVMAGLIGRQKEAQSWQQEADRRCALIRELCWDEEQGFFFEYQFTTGRRLPYWSLAAYWTLWTDIATPQQVDRLVAQLPRFEYDHGLVQTLEKYPSPHPEFVHLQWDFPSGWPTFQILICEALIRRGYSDIARRIAQKYLRLQLDLYQSTGKLWEKYNVIEGNLNLPVERYPAVPLHGWSCTSIAYLGRLLF